MNRTKVKKYKLKRKTIFVSITKTLKGLSVDTSPITIPLPEIARGCWKVVAPMAAQCELLAAVVADTIVGIWEIDRTVGWQKMTANWSPARNKVVVNPRLMHCTLKSSIANRTLIGVDVTSIEKMKSMRGPVQYNF